MPYGDHTEQHSAIVCWRARVAWQEDHIVWALCGVFLLVMLGELSVPLSLTHTDGRLTHSLQAWEPSRQP